jgi:anti-sigma-K factor RskA
MQRHDDEHLWDLLGHAPRPEVSPFFARNVLRAVRQLPAQRWQALSWLNWRRLIPVSGLAAALAMAMFFAYQHARQEPPQAADDDLIAKIDAQDYEVVADLDELLASDENNLWDDNSSL